MLKKLLIFMCLSFWALSSHAASVTWEIKAAITAADVEMVGYANIGDVITLRYTFDSETLDTEPFVMERGKYEGAVTKSDIFLNGGHAHFGNGGYVAILNLPTGDSYFSDTAGTAGLTETLPGYNGYDLYGYRVNFSDSDATMFNDTSLIIDPIFNGYDSFNITLTFLKPVGGVFYGSSIRAEQLISIERISAVPVPAAVWLFGSGLIGLIGFARRKE